jgi:hypothetical protein
MNDPVNERLGDCAALEPRVFSALVVRHGGDATGTLWSLFEAIWGRRHLEL